MDMRCLSGAAALLSRCRPSMERSRGGSVQRQVPLAHCCPLAQLTPQLPQLERSAATLTQRQACVLELLQKRFPPLHDRQVALSQCSDPEQVFPQAPQFSSS